LKQSRTPGHQELPYAVKDRVDMEVQRKGGNQKDWGRIAVRCWNQDREEDMR